MVSKTFNIFASKSQPKATRDALDVAARYFIYKIYDATRREPMNHSACSQVGENTKSAQATKNLNIERHRR